MEELLNLEYSTIRSSETPVPLVPILPISIRYSKTKKILSKILNKLPKLADLYNLNTSFYHISGSKSNYYGQVIYSKMHGIGQEIYNTGLKYYGEFSEGKQNGLGYLSIKNTKQWKEYYIGSFIDGRFSGYGEYYCDKNYYKGDWLDDLKHGFGKEKVGRTYYKGQFLFGSKVGEGKLSGGNGKFKGEFLNDKFVKGKFVERAGRFVYSGNWEDGVWNGRGKIKFKTGSPIKSFSGEFIHGRFGAGILRFPDGKKIVHKLEK